MRFTEDLAELAQRRAREISRKNVRHMRSAKRAAYLIAGDRDVESDAERKWDWRNNRFERRV